ncbi:hypothetical protein P875_00064667 [Aspergillus parasiticus SU-1]|uniref:Secreted protein n=1 Tax=Aspergillus parasiticus (strain ATCC 56775 / NRRL 5862 / SRRC 143 / SU-1) TaxID=1403190 RepID=A0A0F0I833_ASPPU|nr:hypothetical protein P875_00064667 [Aspergillus parasiticus SU-1]
MKTFSVVILLMGLGIGMATPPPQGESDKVVSQLILESVYILDFAQLRFLTVEQKFVSTHIALRLEALRLTPDDCSIPKGFGEHPLKNKGSLKLWLTCSLVSDVASTLRKYRANPALGSKYNCDTRNSWKNKR